MKYISIFIAISIATYVYADLTLDDIIEASTINLIWTYNDKQSSSVSPYIIPEPYKRQVSSMSALKEVYEYAHSFNRIFLWARLNPNTKIIIWYNKKTIADGALEKTIKEFEKLGIENQITLIDVNERFKDENFSAFFDAELPLYYRADILRILATVKHLNDASKNGMTAFFIYVDLSIDPRKLKNLLAYEHTVKNLNENGIIVGKTDQQSYENSFHIIGNNKPNIIVAIQGAIINKNLVRIAKWKNNKGQQTIDEQAVYSDYQGLMPLFFALENKAKIRNKKSSQIITSSELIHMTQVEQLSSKVSQPLYSYFENDINFIEYQFEPSEELKLELTDKSKPYGLPTRSCVSKTSKINQ